MYDLQTLKEILLGGGYTCVLSDGESLIKRTERGVKPILSLLDRHADCRGYLVADKVVGKAAALLYAKLGIAALYAHVISEPAVKMCEKYGISLEYGSKTPRIVNRSGDGMCPMEQAVYETDDFDEAEISVRKKLAELSEK